MKDVSIAISRTLPAFMGRPEVREVETLYLDMVASAQRFIYIEHQYFTSARIGEALAARLKEENGPEILVILPSEFRWLEENSMGFCEQVSWKVVTGGCPWASQGILSRRSG
jgi:phospholipase D1/2